MSNATTWCLASWLAIVPLTFCEVAAGEVTDVFDEYPTRFAYVNGVTIAYQDIGNPSGVPVVMIIGLGVQLTYWGDSFLRSFIEHGYRLILLDNRDAGLSERFEQYGIAHLAAAFALLDSGEPFEPPYTLYDMADDVVGLLDHLDIESAHVGGASMGGMIAQIVAGRYPERVRSLISIMSTSGAAHLPQTSFDAVPARPPLDAPREVQIRFGIEMMRADAGNNAEIFDEAHARLRTAKDYNRSHGWTGEGRQLLATMSSGDRVEILRSIKQKSLVMHGDFDPYFSLAHAEHTAQLLRNSKLVVIKGMGHSVEPALVPAITQAIFAYIDACEAVAGGRTRGLKM